MSAAGSGVLSLAFPLIPLDEVSEQVHRERKDDGGVLLGADRVQGLQVAQLNIVYC